MVPCTDRREMRLVETKEKGKNASLKFGVLSVHQLKIKLRSEPTAN